MESPILILISLRYDVDSLIKEPIGGDFWWLKPFFSNGKRKGITECCQYDYECEHHKDVRSIIESQNTKLN